MLDLFTHPLEDNPVSQDIYESQKERLSLNAWIILFCMLEGQQLSAIDFVSGISFKGMNNKKIMCEYRRRISELRKAAIETMSITGENGIKIHWIPTHLIPEYRAKYEPFKNELLNKIN